MQAINTSTAVEEADLNAIFVEKNKFEEYQKEGKLLLDPYYSDKLNQVKIKRRAIDRISKKRWRPTQNVIVSVCSQYIE